MKKVKNIEALTDFARFGAERPCLASTPRNEAVPRHEPIAGLVASVSMGGLTAGQKKAGQGQTPSRLAVSDETIQAKQTGQAPKGPVPKAIS
ncbi:MAG: hypothetical protein LBT00_03540 [Spirochaetaceae bacterium]|nr:hypothetical protein [Spirochaetaceae bacterium]